MFQIYSKLKIKLKIKCQYYLRRKKTILLNAKILKVIRKISL